MERKELFQLRDDETGNTIALVSLVMRKPLGAPDDPYVLLELKGHTSLYLPPDQARRLGNLLDSAVSTIEHGTAPPPLRS